MLPLFFKSAYPFSFVVDSSALPTPQELSAQLEQNIYKPLQKDARQTFGFSPIMGYNDIEDTRMYYQKGALYLFTITFEEKKINRSKLSKLFAKKQLNLATQKETTVANLSKEDVAVLRDEAVDELLRNTASEETYIGVLIDVKGERLYLSDGSEGQRNKAINIVKNLFLACIISDFEVDSISIILTSWLSDIKQQLPEEIDLLHSVRLVDSFDGKAGLTNHKLDCLEVSTLLENGKHVVEIEVTFLDRLAFKLTDACVLKSIKILKPIEDLIEYQPAIDVTFDIYSLHWDVMFSEISEMYIWLRKLINSHRN